MRNVRSGPVELIVTLDHATAQIAEPLTLTLTVQAPNGVTVTFPQDQASLGSFNVLEVSDTPDVPTDRWSAMDPPIPTRKPGNRQANDSASLRGLRGRAPGDSHSAESFHHRRWT